jgi:pantoate--beta-alanine ligase
MLAAGSSLNVAPSVKLLPSMEIIRTISWMKEVSRQARAENQIIGLVPTMGALHEGHFSLIRRARQECSKVFTSIFVNSKQFGPNEDFAKYPRAFESDVEQLAAAGVDAVFAPEAAEMYPGGFHSYVNVEGLSERLEGRTRPGHFRGVATVVLKLFQIFQPHVAYFGRKDAQQVRIVQQMARDLNLDVEIAVCPIVRERDGLALSSRNSYLSAQERAAATVLHRALDAAGKAIAFGTRDALELQRIVREVVEREALATLDYAEIVDAETFEPVVRLARSSYVLLAVFLGKTRLIDNLFISPSPADPDELVLSL